ncbi:acetate kinase [Rhodobacteraceae bacterium LMO-12]|nr:acetate kinase [Rhodobacteraceae bacterium LMO-JJ12]
MSDQLVVTFNAGSSSLRCAVYRLSDDGPLQIRNLSIRGLPDNMILTEKDPATGARTETDLGTPDSAESAHPEALKHMFARLDGLSGLGKICAFSHRVVHGGPNHAAPVQVDDDLVDWLMKLQPLAPSHQAHNLRPMQRIKEHFPDVPQVACFDTAFHRTQPRLAQIFGLPRELTDDGVLRYGFHGLSYDYIAHELKRSDPDLAAKRIIVAHLGRGVSMCAMKNGQSIATTMGLTALDGLPMGRRSGGLDPGVVLHLIIDRGYSAEEVREMLYDRSGLLGVSGISGEMNDLLASGRAEAAEAVDFFVYQCGRHFGSLAAALGGVDGVILTGGMGEHIAPLRARLVQQLGWLGADLDDAANQLGGPYLTTKTSRLPVLALPTDEERVLARSAYELLANSEA